MPVRPELSAAQRVLAVLDAAHARAANALEGKESYGVTLPDSRDPADWLAEHGSRGLLAFTRGYCPDLPDQVAPVHFGRCLARVLAEQDGDIVSLKSAFAYMGPKLSQRGVRWRFASEAARGLAKVGLGPGGWRERQLCTALAVNWQQGVSSNGVHPGAPRVGI